MCARAMIDGNGDALSITAGMGTAPTAGQPKGIQKSKTNVKPMFSNTDPATLHYQRIPLQDHTMLHKARSLQEPEERRVVQGPNVKPVNLHKPTAVLREPPITVQQNLVVERPPVVVEQPTVVREPPICHRRAEGCG